jgi:hypothetical protein
VIVAHCFRGRMYDVGYQCIRRQATTATMKSEI